MLLLSRMFALFLLIASVQLSAASRYHHPRKPARSTHRTPATPHVASVKAGETHTFSATAYCQKGRTSSGRIARVRHTVAADPHVLPPGSKIRVSHAGSYSGVYSVEDQGKAVRGRTIDLFIPRLAEARQFGRKQVEVTLLSQGEPAP